MPKYSSGPLKGQRNRLSDLRCGWKKAAESEREAFLADLLADPQAVELLAKLRREAAPEPCENCDGGPQVGTVHRTNEGATFDYRGCEPCGMEATRHGWTFTRFTRAS